MRKGLVARRAAAARLSVGALAFAGLATTGMLFGAAGCAVGEKDVQRWETTEGGPEKLYAIVVHDKYSWPLRQEAALSLIHMRPRNGKRIGLEYIAVGYDTSAAKVPGALSVLSDDARRKVVNGITPNLVAEMQKPAPARAAGGEVVQADPSIPYKDAAFAIVSHEPPLASDEKAKSDIIAALAQWVQTDFEARIDNTSQQFGVEQIMRFIGAPAVKSLPSVITESSTKVDRACSLIADIGDDDTKKRASDALVTLAKAIDSPAWIAKQKALVLEANKASKSNATEKQVSDQLTQYQEQELEKVLTNMKRVGGRPAVDYCLGFARDKSKSEKMRTDALAALENRVDKGNANDVNTIFDIVRDDTNTDKVRGVALARLGELPKEILLSKLYSLFDKKWQVRLDAEAMILKTMSTKELPDFLHRLPSDKAKISLSEAVSCGQRVMGMDPGAGPKPRTVLNGFLESKELGAKLCAVGSYYGVKKGDAGGLSALEGDKTVIPKCATEDQCGWSCDVNKETKTVTTVGEFVKWCVEPSLTP
jgi:hypothetical protein